MSENLKSADIHLIQRIIPHRYPFLLVDKVIEIDNLQSALGIKNVTINEPFFQGHFPNAPVMPGVTIVEALAQTAAVMVGVSLSLVDKNLLIYFMGIDNANTYDVEYSKDGYFTDTLEVTLVNGEIVVQNIALLPKESFSKTGKIVDSLGNGIPNCNLMISSNFFKDSLTTNQLGEFILDTLYQSDYTFYYGSWGYRTKCAFLIL